MKQTRAMSLAAALANVVMGYGVAVTTQMIIFPFFGLHTNLGENLLLGSIFTLVSLVRSYTLRRIFRNSIYGTSVTKTPLP